ncbi:MAG: hypothetical protein R2861_01085 [Desulfobacterales bacterium]
MNPETDNYLKNYTQEKYPDASGHFGPYGGRYVAETLMPALIELEAAYNRFLPDARFQKELRHLLKITPAAPPRYFSPGGLPNPWAARPFI